MELTFLFLFIPELFCPWTEKKKSSSVRIAVFHLSPEKFKSLYLVIIGQALKKRVKVNQILLPKVTDLSLHSADTVEISTVLIINFSQALCLMLSFLSGNLDIWLHNFSLKIYVPVMYFSAYSLQTLANSGKVAKEESCIVREFNSGLWIFHCESIQGLEIIKKYWHFIPSVTSISSKNSFQRVPIPVLSLARWLRWSFLALESMNLWNDLYVIYWKVMPV